MVQDPRVSRQLARLGGIYRDPARVNRDASSLLKSSVGQHLQPIAAVHTDDRGHTDTVLVLQGTIAIHFRGNTYQLLMDIYLTSGYPNRPPVAYIRLAPNMYLKENHKHVGTDGKVYLPYLHEWRPDTHNLVELTVAMSSVFSADPPVFSRPAAAPVSPPRPSSSTASAVPSWNQSATYPPATTVSNTANTTTTNISSSNGTSNSNSNWRTQQEELERALAASAAEAAAVDAERVRLERVELEAAQRESAAAAYEQAQRQQLREALRAKLQAQFRQLALETRQCVHQDAHDQNALVEREHLSEQMEFYTRTKLELERRCISLDKAIVDIEVWLKDAAASQKSNSKQAAPTKSIDEICVPASKLSAQQLELATENAAIEDALYCLDRALYAERLNATQHLKQVRQLAKRQFLVKAHLIKIQQHCGGAVATTTSTVRTN